MTDTSTENKKTITLDENDVALIFKEDGHVDLSFPEILEQSVPEHVMAALVLSYSVMDEEFFDVIQERFAEQAYLTLEEEFRKSQCKKEETEGKNNKKMTLSSSAPHLKIVS